MKTPVQFNFAFAAALGAIALYSLSGCAEAPAKATMAAENVKAPTRAMSFVATRLPNSISVDLCPASPTSWHREDLSKLLEMANACVQAKKIDRLEDMANFMAQQFVIEPWGAFYLSVAAEQRHDLPRALWMVDLALKKAPHGALFYYQRGRVHWQLNDLTTAVDDFNASVKENNKMADAHLILAQYYTRSGDLKSAEKHYQEVVKVEPENHSVLAEFAEIELLMNHSTYALELYERAASASPSNIDYRVRLGYLYEVNQKNYEQALSFYRKAKALMGESRTPADARANEVNEKIKKLEALVSPEPKQESQVTSAAQPPKAQVNK